MVRGMQRQVFEKAIDPGRGMGAKEVSSSCMGKVSREREGVLDALVFVVGGSLLSFCQQTKGESRVSR